MLAANYMLWATQFHVGSGAQGKRTTFSQSNLLNRTFICTITFKTLFWKLLTVILRLIMKNGSHEWWAWCTGTVDFK